jgi:hypothetical protein
MKQFSDLFMHIISTSTDLSGTSATPILEICLATILALLEAGN